MNLDDVYKDYLEECDAIAEQCIALTEFIGYDEYGIPMFETVKRIPEAN